LGGLSSKRADSGGLSATASVSHPSPRKSIFDHAPQSNEASPAAETAQRATILAAARKPVNASEYSIAEAQKNLFTNT
jgi:hypothetical protein